jgi:hypothetical protein
MSEEGPPLSLEQARSAATAGRLPDLTAQLVADRRWSSLEVVLTLASTPSVPIEEVASALRSLLEALTTLSEGDRKEAEVELRQAYLHAATSLARRSQNQPLTARDRTGLTIAAGLFAALGELRRAATLYETAGDDAHAADAWGALGELEKMEACLGREEDRRNARLRSTDLRRRFEVLFAAGARQAALEAVADLGATDLDSQDLLTRARAIATRLRRGLGVSLRLVDGRILRVAGLPAALGRDPAVEIPVREPTVSRRHARLLAEDQLILLEDAGSRSGTLLSGQRVGGRVPLRGEGEIALGGSCRLRFHQIGTGLLLEGLGGLDRDHLSLSAAGEVDLSPVLGAGCGLRLDFGDRSDLKVARLLGTVGEPLRVDGQLVGQSCDLLAGERVETVRGLRLEVL